ncbi:MAG: sensor histidine kinase [Phycisphaerae bacterium]
MHVTQSEKLDSTQEQLEKLQLEVEALRRQLHNAHRLATMGTMTAMVAHEFNNILTPIVNYAHLARKNPKMIQKAIDRAADGGERAATICQAILDLASGKTAAFPEQTDLRTLIHETLTAIGRDFGKDSIQMEIDIPENFVIVTRKVELEQVLLNLLVNARAALLKSNRIRKIRIRAESRENCSVIEIADTADGIKPEILPNIFDAFFTTKEDADKSQGYGLGLAICRDLIAALGGEISVDSTVGEGSIFTVRLPKQM